MTMIYIKKDNKLVPVTREQYLAYYRDVWRIRKRAQAHGQCFCTKKNLWKCDGDCLVCQYHSIGDVYSLDTVYKTEDGEGISLKDTIPNLSPSIEDDLEEKSLIDKLYRVLDELDPEASCICKLFMQGKSERDIATIMNIPRSTFKYRWEKIKAILNSNLKDYL